MKIVKIVLINALLILISNVNYAQFAKPKFEHLTVDNGLPSNRVTCFLRDSKGFLWIGGEPGLARFDGYTVKVFSHTDSDTNSLSHNIIRCLFEDSYHNIWIGTQNGLNLYNPERDCFKIFRYNEKDENSISNNNVLDINEDKYGNVILATDKGLNKWNQTKRNFTRIVYKKNFSEGINLYTRSMCIDQNGYVWFAPLGNKIYCLDTRTDSVINYNKMSLLPEERFKTIIADKENRIWIAYNGFGLYRFNPKTQEVKQYPTTGNNVGVNDKAVRDLLLYNDRYLLFAVDHGGINILDTKTDKFDYILYDKNKTEGLNNDGIWSIYVDYENILWVGTSSGGVNYWNRKKERFKTYRNNIFDTNSLIYDVVFRIFGDSEGKIWLGTDGGGLSIFDPKTENFMNYSHNENDKNSISSNAVLSFAEDKESNVWCGTWAFGLNKFDKKTKTFKRVYYAPDSKDLSIHNIYALDSDTAGNLWISAFGDGLYIFNEKTNLLRHYKNEDKANLLPNNNVIGIYREPTGVMGVYSYNGYARYNQDKAAFTLLNNLTGVEVRDVLLDKEGDLWIGLPERGIIVMRKNGTIDTLTTDDGLVSNAICGILEADNGDVWISSASGLTHYNKTTKKYRHYNESDGLQGKQFFAFARYKAKDGTLYFGGYKGFNAFHPDSIVMNDYIPQVYINEFQIFNKTVIPNEKKSPLKKVISETKEIVLTYKQSVFSFGFAAINITYPEKCKYAYKMHGFDNEWNYTDASRRYVTYTNLEPGEYTFQVKASNNDEIWNETGTSIKIIIKPPYWKTWWFRTLVVLFIIGSAFGYYRYKVNELKAQKRILEKKVRERTAELQEANTMLEEKQEEIMQQAEELRAINDELGIKNTEIERSYAVVNRQNDNIKGSIRYAQTIQEAILISKTELNKYFDNFLIYKPKDIVSGDFYWFYNLESPNSNLQTQFIAVVDCTGHGVPGAFMSLISNTLLNEILHVKKIYEPAKILFELNKDVKASLKQEFTDNDDGMDMCLCRIERCDNQPTKVTFAGAKRPLYHYHASERKVETIKGDLQSIGGRFSKDAAFTEHEICINKNDCLYLTSDGFNDQPNMNRRRFSIRKFIERIEQTGHLPIAAQRLAFETAFELHRENQGLRDDITMLAIKFD